MSPLGDNIEYILNCSASGTSVFISIMVIDPLMAAQVCPLGSLQADFLSRRGEWCASWLAGG